jgi:hypothetical protein
MIQERAAYVSKKKPVRDKKPCSKKRQDEGSTRQSKLNEPRSSQSRSGSKEWTMAWHLLGNPVPTHNPFSSTSSIVIIKN